MCSRVCIQPLRGGKKNIYKTYSRDISCEIDGKSFYALSYFLSFFQTFFYHHHHPSFSHDNFYLDSHIFFHLLCLFMLLYLQHSLFLLLLMLLSLYITFFQLCPCHSFFYIHFYSIGDSTVIIFVSMCIILHLTNFPTVLIPLKCQTKEQTTKKKQCAATPG